MIAAPGNELIAGGDEPIASQLLEIWLAPRPAAEVIAVLRSEIEELLASTRSRWQLGHRADAASRSSDSSCSQLALPLGSGPGLPVWLTLRKQPLAVVHGASPYLLRYTARSASALGSS